MDNNSDIKKKHDYQYRVHSIDIEISLIIKCPFKAGLYCDLLATKGENTK